MLSLPSRNAATILREGSINQWNGHHQPTGQPTGVLQTCRHTADFFYEVCSQKPFPQHIFNRPPYFFIKKDRIMFRYGGSNVGAPFQKWSNAKRGLQVCRYVSRLIIKEKLHFEVCSRSAVRVFGSRRSAARSAHIPVHPIS